MELLEIDLARVRDYTGVQVPTDLEIYVLAEAETYWQEVALRVLRRRLADLNTGDGIASVKLEQGSVATPYQSPTYADNLRECRYYYQRFGGMSPFQQYGLGKATSATQLRVQIPLISAMRRVNPTVTYGSLAIDGVGADVTAVNLDSAGENVIELTVTSSGITTSEVYGLRSDNSLSAWLAFDARL